jgi:hypothetical protein
MYPRPVLESPFLARPYFAQLVFAGFAATVAMSAMVYGTALLGVPNIDFAGVLGALLTGEPSKLLSPTWWAGMAWHFVNGSLIFALLFAFFFQPGVGFAPSVQGMIWGTILWLVAQAVILPLLGAGFFSMRLFHPITVLATSLVAHWIYGGVLGAFSRARIADILEVHQDQAA